VFENRVLRRIFGPKRDEEMGGWRKMHNEEFHNMYPSPNVIIMIKSRRMKWAGCYALACPGLVSDSFHLFFCLPMFFFVSWELKFYLDIMPQRI
jgi:hypothetical protein